MSAILPRIAQAVSHDPEFLTIMAKKQEMTAKGYHEVLTYSLTKKGDFQVAKGPKGKDFLRTNLLDGLRAAYAVNKQNEELLPNATANIFEIGKVFPKTGEELHVAWIDAKGEHEEILVVDAESLSTTILTRPPTASTLSTAVERGRAFSPWSEYPFMTRDVAVWLPENVPAEELLAVITAHGTSLMQGTPRLFDQFTKDGLTSYAYRMVFQAFDRTLTDDEINPIMDKVYGAIKAKGWKIR
ncbi:hypothetical protein EBR96_11085 [bacterium]|nr:hypothetical protein [bacterium]